ncbi:MAG TPA: hypothetical protein P5067_03345 [Candidatus Marinimicrobia bacterium]|nr:hypothetical protein [Candidatus Neomarinimicrobiota bacterium]
MTVTCVEVFLNMFFRILLEESRFEHLKEQTIKEMESTRFGLESKIRKWPERFFHKNFINSKAGKEFIKYKKIRNGLIHYQATCKEIVPFPTPFNKYGVTDTSIFHNLEYDYVQNSKNVVKGVIEEMFKLSGHLNSHPYFTIDNWTGEIDNKLSHI